MLLPILLFETDPASLPILQNDFFLIADGLQNKFRARCPAHAAEPHA
jgi:hypothetical protein